MTYDEWQRKSSSKMTVSFSPLLLSLPQVLVEATQPKHIASYNLEQCITVYSQQQSLFAFIVFLNSLKIRTLSCSSVMDSNAGSLINCSRTCKEHNDDALYTILH